MAWIGLSSSSNAVSWIVSDFSRTGVMRVGPQQKRTSGSRPAGHRGAAAAEQSAGERPARSPSSEVPTGCISISSAASRGEMPNAVVSGPPFSSPSVASSSSLTV